MVGQLIAGLCKLADQGTTNYCTTPVISGYCGTADILDLIYNVYKVSILTVYDKGLFVLGLKYYPTY